MTDLWALFQEKNEARQKPKSAATIRQENGYWRNVIEPTIGSMKVEDVTPRHLAEMSKKLAKTSPTSANRLHALLSSLFKPALEHGWITIHPRQWLDRPGGSEAPRKRYLSDDEIRLLWPALDNLRRNPRDQLKIGLLTAQRPGEIANMRWADIDFDNATWTQETTKTGNTFICPLSSQVIAILQHRKDNPGRRYKDNPSEYVFPSAYNVHKGADGTCAGIPIKQARQLCKNLGMEEWTPHDLRRTARTIMSRLQIKPHVRERVLNHAQGKIEKVYDQFDYLDEKRAAMNKLGDEIDRIIGIEHTAKIIPMRAAK
jgi:integrase